MDHTIKNIASPCALLAQNPFRLFKLSKTDRFTFRKWMMCRSDNR
ncbi:Uncharacterised protein [Vibrio cholerae]|nr:Uncharacterised protein [Vibrio cholerae]